MSTPPDAPPAAAGSPPSGPALPPATAYQQQRDRALTEVAQREEQARRIGLLRLLAFFLALGGATAAYEGFPAGVPGWIMGLVALAALVAFVWLVLRHDAVLRQRDRALLRAEL
ncbi:MAG TPA: hypothetical protein PLW65_27715, partial [Pseudomonadota bacterium]|nr:hypothetical protein [Pseudomonadota bacterium]